MRVLRITSPTAHVALKVADDELPYGRACVIVHRLGRDALTVSRSGAQGVDLLRAGAAGLDVAVRRTGGGAVVWDEDLVALDVVLPRGDARICDDVAESYRWVGEACQRALIALRIDGVRLIGPHSARMSTADTPLCFASLGPWEVTIHGRKAVGLCAARRAAGQVIQVGIPIHLDAERIGRAMDVSPVTLRTRAVGVAQMDPDLTRQAVEIAVLRELGAAI